MKYNKFVKNISETLFGEDAIKNALHIFNTLINDDLLAYDGEDIQPYFFKHVLRNKLTSISVSVDGLDGDVYNSILHGMVDFSNDDPIIAHVVANCLDKFELKRTDKLQLKINYNINKDDVLNEMLLSTIKTPIKKNMPNKELLNIYFVTIHLWEFFNHEEFVNSMED